MQNAVEGLNYLRLVGSVQLRKATARATDALLDAGETRWVRQVPGAAVVLDFAQSERDRRMLLAHFRSLSPEDQIAYVTEMRKRPRSQWSKAETAVWDYCSPEGKFFAESKLVASLVSISMTQWSESDHEAYGEVLPMTRGFVADQWPPIGQPYSRAHERDAIVAFYATSKQRKKK